MNDETRGKVLDDGTIKWVVKDHGPLATIPSSTFSKITVLDTSVFPNMPEKLDAFIVAFVPLGGSLKKLNYSNNNLASLPESIGRLASLKELHCYNNGLTSLPESIGQLASLQKLWCSENKITSLPESMGELSLEIFGGVAFYTFQKTNPLDEEFKNDSWPKLRAYLRWWPRVRLLWIGHREFGCPFSLLPSEIVREIRDKM